MEDIRLLIGEGRGVCTAHKKIIHINKMYNDTITYKMSLLRNKNGKCVYEVINNNYNLPTYITSRVE